MLESSNGERGVRLCERDNPADTKVDEEGGRGDAPGTGAEIIPLQTVRKTMVRQAVPLQPMEVQISTCSLWKGPHAGAGECLKEAVSLLGTCAGAGSCQDLWSCGEQSPCWSRLAGRACDPLGDPRWSSLFLKDCTLWEGPMLEQFVKSCSPWEGLMLEKFVENCLP